MAGEMFGPYRLEGLLGRGGMGEVFRAFDTGRNRVVALKRLPSALAADPEFQARFRSESALAARLNEPHIVPIHDYGEINGRLFIDMRLVEGVDLGVHLTEHGPLTPERAVNVITQVAAALDAAHAAGMVHRDIKPANVLLTNPSNAGAGGDGEFVYVADFGIARAISSNTASLTATGATVGSLEYMAPERFIGGHGDHRVDVYSLGCLLYEALTARKPFPGEGFPAMIHGHLNLPPPRSSELRPEIPAGLDDVIATAMAKDPDQRYPSTGALATAARAALIGRQGAVTITTPEPARQPWDNKTPFPSPQPGPQYLPGFTQPPPPDPLPADRRRRWLILLAIVALILASVGTGAAFALNSDAQSSKIILEPIRTPGVNPFMPNVGHDRPGVTPPPGASGTYSGNLSGLYGGTLNNAQCDSQAMVEFLRSHPDKGAAWASVQKITPAQIPDYVAGLTPVILRSDTAVTNHGFADGEATTLHSVLQAGTAVLVDKFGVPRARCYCGNPLSPAAQPDAPQYTGPSWPAFKSSQVVTVEPAPSEITEFTLVDPATDQIIYRPTGTSGTSDRTPSPNAVPAVAPPPPDVSPPAVPYNGAPEPQNQVPPPAGRPDCDAGQHREGDRGVGDERRGCDAGQQREGDRWVDGL
ncbi:MAG: hypothetical protein QOI10_4414, partial [Solirubrobacterales bacterium]|nr:hypothetical protein [Solirubrobacterales bacterium]